MHIALKDRITGNRFAEQVHALRIDRAAFDALREDLSALARDWQEDSGRDKEVTEYLFVLWEACDGAVARLRERGRAAEADELERMTSTLKELTLRAVAAGGPVD